MMTDCLASTAVPALDARNVTVRYRNVVALESVTAGFEIGRIHAIVGQNGAGKTTFARVAAGLVPRSKGQVLVSSARRMRGIRPQ